MNSLIKIDEEYKSWVKKISYLYKQRQIKAAISINKEMLLFYWSLGEDIVKLEAESK